MSGVDGAINLICDTAGHTLLHLGVKTQNSDIVDLLLKYGAKIDEPSACGMTAIQYASLGGSLRILLTLIVNKADINIKTHYRSPLHLAISHRNTEFTNALLDSCADPNYQDLDGQTSLHMCISQNSHISTLLTYGANVDIQDRYGQTPLHLAILQGDLQYVEILIASNADPSIIDIFGKSPLDCVRLLSNSKLQHVMYKCILDYIPID